MRQPQLRFVTVKSAEQQARLVVHRVRQGWQEERTAGINRLRGLLAEFGRVYREQRVSCACRRASGTGGRNTTAAHCGVAVARQLEHLRELDAQMADMRSRDRAGRRATIARAQRLLRLSGVGVLTASAVAATVADPTQFRCGRQFAAWIGLTPRQYSTGGKPRLGRITRRGDTYLRALLVQGARSALQAALRAAPPRRNRLAAWIVRHLRAHRLSQDTGRHRQQARAADLGAATRDEPLRAHAAVN